MSSGNYLIDPFMEWFLRDKEGNMCSLWLLDSTVKWIDETPDSKGWDQTAKESLAVGVWNGAVYEPKLKNK